jgi:hypothetical protein
VRVAAARDDELKQALKAMERRLEMREYLKALLLSECVVCRSAADDCGLQVKTWGP